jgi:hypothetical protein
VKSDADEDAERERAEPRVVVDAPDTDEAEDAECAEWREDEDDLDDVVSADASEPEWYDSPCSLSA